MTEIPTAAGPVSSADLGRTLVHEHVFVLTPDVQQNYPGEWHEETRVADAIDRLRALKAAGIDTIVDPTVVGLGRYVPRIARIAAQVELNIVVATGIYTYRDVPRYFRMRSSAIGADHRDPMVGMFIGDLTVGIADTGVRAGLLKCAIDAPGMTRGVERVMRAVAQAHVATGAPVMIHTAPHRHTGLAVDDLLASERVSPQSVLLAHCGDTSDADHLSRLADLGYLLGMDRFGIDVIATFEQRVDIVVEMVRRGYVDRLMLAQDAACYIDWLDAATAASMPNWHYLHIANDVLPALRERGVSHADIETMLIDNPRRWLEGGRIRSTAGSPGPVSRGTT